MALEETKTRRVLDSVGIACLVVTFVMLSSGVRAVRAESPEEARMSIDPALASPAAPAPTPPPKAIDATSPDAERAGVPAVEVEPGVVVLNTRGFNYGPPVGGIDPKAMEIENLPRRRSPGTPPR